MRSLRLRDALRREDGMTLTEVMIAALVTAVAATLFMGALSSVNTSVTQQATRSRNNDEVRLAVQQLDREVRSGNLLYNPASESPANYTFRVYSQSNAQSRCIQWILHDSKLLRRTWAPTFGPALPDPSTVSSWRPVATGIVNRTLPTPVPAFLLAGTTAAVGRTLDVTLVADTSRTPGAGGPARVTLSITGRNTTRGSAQDACDPAPAMDL